MQFGTHCIVNLCTGSSSQCHERVKCLGRFLLKCAQVVVLLQLLFATSLVVAKPVIWNKIQYENNLYVAGVEDTYSAPFCSTLGSDYSLASFAGNVADMDYVLTNLVSKPWSCDSPGVGCHVWVGVVPCECSGPVSRCYCWLNPWGPGVGGVVDGAAWAPGQPKSGPDCVAAWWQSSTSWRLRTHPCDAHPITVCMRKSLQVPAPSKWNEIWNKGIVYASGVDDTYSAPFCSALGSGNSLATFADSVADMDWLLTNLVNIPFPCDSPGGCYAWVGVVQCECSGPASRCYCWLNPWGPGVGGVVDGAAWAPGEPKSGHDCVAAWSQTNTSRWRLRTHPCDSNLVTVCMNKPTPVPAPVKGNEIQYKGTVYVAGNDATNSAPFCSTLGSDYSLAAFAGNVADMDYVLTNLVSKHWSCDSPGATCHAWVGVVPCECSGSASGPCYCWLNPWGPGVGGAVDGAAWAPGQPASGPDCVAAWWHTSTSWRLRTLPCDSHPVTVCMKKALPDEYHYV